MQPLRTSATQRAATITPGLFAPVISVITITGIGDHLRPELTGPRLVVRFEC
jgi:hypothetical protein